MLATIQHEKMTEIPFGATAMDELTNDSDGLDEKSKRKPPKWMEPLGNPELMPQDLKVRADFTHDEKMVIWKGLLYAQATKRSARSRILSLSKQRRKDEDHRKFVLGAAVLMEIGSTGPNSKFASLIDELLKRWVGETEQFLFPRLFPKATRPVRGTKKNEAAAMISEPDED
jgi:hypothetical protein